MRHISMIAAALAACLYAQGAGAQPTVAPATPEPKATPKPTPKGDAPLAGAPCANPPCGGPGAGPGPGMKGGMGEPGRGMRFGRDNTHGWTLMSREERQAHRDKMMGLKSIDECKAYAETHRKEMEARAKERGKAMPAPPRVDMCERMSQRGMFGKP
jgi:hypothetical protein